MGTRNSRRVFPLAHALVLLLLLMLPAMLLLGAAEGREGGPTLLFFVLMLLPFVLLLWLLTCCAPEEAADGPRAAAQHVPRDRVVAAEFERLVAPIVRPSRSYVAEGVPIVEGTPQLPRTELFPELDRRLAPYRVIPLVEEVDGRSVRVVGLPRGVAERLRSRSSGAVNLLLLVATVLTTVYAGARQQGINLLENPGQFPTGIPYALSLLSILGVHELGHYAMARRYGVDVTLPYFIPVPMGLGTFGAFIQMKSLIKSRRAVFDIGIAGPLAGLVVAVPLLYSGLTHAGAMPAADGPFALNTGSSLLLALLYQAAHGNVMGTAAVHLSPAAFAGWIGVFVTALNLLPVGQLDGGHVAYGLFGRRHAQTVSLCVVLLMVGLGLFVWPGFLTWALIVSLLAGFSHMPALDDVTPPDTKRFALGILTLALPIVIMMPVPGALDSPTLDSPYQGRYEAFPQPASPASLDAMHRNSRPSYR
ncbi:MAG: site-2 protease family protein [Acidobacteria bacterium]|nr:MAG: site-2 protease family protein [Acidobacteriota bacterium]